ncbi:protein kinase [Actinoplanes sp. NBC_00393]|uniref:serine/threonine-protein kinase n=1 Tax=Actinoplanes sp. NBC_00393 TaxID=2975953 RepID=UPI002E246B9E
MNTGDLMDGRFRLRDRLGAGGMAVVWRAHDEVLGRDVALKVLAPDLARDAMLLARIRDEARAVARLRHPNIVDVYDYGEAPLPYVVMEVVEGRSLSQLLTGGALPWRLASVIGAQVAAALAAAHQQGVVHRDVKPGNVVVGGSRVKLVDFGISASSGDDDRAAGQVLGTPAYLAPERLENGVVRPATDVYALGLLLYRTLAGRLPWQASTTTEMLAAHRYQEPSPLPPIAGLPDEVAALCRQCLEKDPDRRPGAAEVAVALATVAGLSPANLGLPGEPAEEATADIAEPTALVAATTTNATAAAPASAATTAGAAATAPVIAAAPALNSPFVIAAKRWRALPRRGRIAVAAGTAAVLLAGTLAAATLPGGGPDGPAAQAGAPAAAAVPEKRTAECSVGYSVAGSANGRFTTKVSIANTGTVPIPAARLTFTLPGEQQRLRAGTPGTWRQNGPQISAQIGDLAAGRSRTATISGTYRAASTLPNRFEVNGTICQAALSVAAATTRPPAAEPAKAAPKKPAAKKAEPEPKKAKKVKPKKAEESDEDEDDENEEDEDE